tara:strand:+ start:4918 stop:5751 length:834 start_codon:yes stop_codon:yes gene_type:complete
MDITIAFMTNYTLDIPNISKQYNTIKSFYNTFKINDNIQIYIFCDEKPLSNITGKIELYNNNVYYDYTIPGLEFENNLKNIEYFKNAILIKTNGLCDGYKKAIDICKTNYLFFLEHDWLFLNNINHSLQEIINFMDYNNEINCILFNKLNNINLPFQKIYNTKEYNIPLCLTNRQSNNPNILRISHAKKIRYPLINNAGCSIHKGLQHYYIYNNMKIPGWCGGIECELCEYCQENIEKIIELGTYLYGPLNHDKTIIHSDICDRDLLNKKSSNIIKL